jgi:hypothetical protein
VTALAFAQKCMRWNSCITPVVALQFDSSRISLLSRERKSVLESKNQARVEQLQFGNKQL